MYGISLLTEWSPYSKRENPQSIWNESHSLPWVTMENSMSLGIQKMYKVLTTSSWPTMK